MKRARFTEEQIIGVLKEQEAGGKTADLARRHGVSEATIYNRSDVLPRSHAIGKLARQMETSDAARPIYRRSDHGGAARA